MYPHHTMCLLHVASLKCKSLLSNILLKVSFTVYFIRVVRGQDQGGNRDIFLIIVKEEARNHRI